MPQYSLQQELDRLFYLLEYSPNSIILTDTAGRIEYVNAVFTSWTGYLSKDVVGRHVDELRLDDLSSTTRAYSWEDTLEGYVWEGELISIRKDGSQFPEQVFLLPITDDKGLVTSVAFIKRDISERKGAERDILGLTDRLEERVSARTAQLAATNSELLATLDQLQQMQDHLVQSEKMASLGELIAGISHEINTPVGISYTAATHLEKVTRDFAKLYASDGIKRSDLRKFMDTCLASTDLLVTNLNRASALIKSFKHVAIDQSGEAKRLFELRPYIDEVLLSLQPVLKKTRHVVQVDGPWDLGLNSYPGAFSQVFTNLITNAINHGYGPGEAGTMTIDFCQEGENLRLTFSDDGRGVSPAALEQIFSPFFTTNREGGGSGLGLHIVYNIVNQQLHGTIRCESVPGMGTAFIITVPLGRGAVTT
ncbi:MAG: ATP-binding protein [Thermodesulfobacteriota bacterium]